jgi:hypothetical protein
VTKVTYFKVKNDNKEGFKTQGQITLRLSKIKMVHPVCEPGRTIRIEI